MPPDQPYAGRFADGTHRFALRVYYEDTDAGGVVYHASYLRFMERARTDMLALCGVDVVAAMETGQGCYVVAAVELRYIRPARLGDALLVGSRMADIRASGCVVQQRVSRDGQDIADGRVTVAFVGPGGRPRRQPAAWVAAFRVAREG